MMRNYNLCLCCFLFTSFAFAGAKITTLVELEKRPGNVAVAPDGAIYFTMHPFDNPKFKIMRLQNGKPLPYPNPQVSEDAMAVIGIQATKNGSLWWLDMGGNGVSPKLVSWNTEANKLQAMYVIPKEVSVPNSFHQDFAIDASNQRAFIADMSRSGMTDESKPAIVVIDLTTGKMRRVLEGYELFQPGDQPVIAEGKAMRANDAQGKSHALKLGLNPIGIDPQNKWVYFASVSPGNLYRVPVAVLGDFSASEESIASAIEVYATKPSSDGIAVADNGVVYITNVHKNAISVANAWGTVVGVQDDKLLWPDGLAVAPDRSLVVTVNQLHRAPIFNAGQSLAKKPYFILRISAP